MKAIRVIKSVGITILVCASLVACNKQSDKTSQGAEPTAMQAAVLPQGVFSDAGQGQTSFVAVSYFPDGAYIELFYSKPTADAKAVLTMMRFGACRANGAQIDCKQTGTTSLASNSVDSTDVDYSFQISMSQDGSYRAKETKRVANGQPQKVDGTWSDTYLALNSQNDMARFNAIREQIPAHFFSIGTPAGAAATSGAGGQQDCIAHADAQVQECIAKDPGSARACQEAHQEIIRACLGR